MNNTNDLQINISYDDAKAIQKFKKVADKIESQARNHENSIKKITDTAQARRLADEQKFQDKKRRMVEQALLQEEIKLKQAHTKMLTSQTSWSAKMTSSLTSVVTSIKSFAAAYVVALASGAVSRVIEYTDNIGDLAAAYNITTQQVQMLNLQLSSAGVNSDRLSNLFGRIQEKLELMSLNSKEGAQAFKEMSVFGITAGDNVYTAFQKIIEGAKNGTITVTQMKDAFGKFGIEAIPILKDTATQMELISKYGFNPISDDTIEKIGTINRELALLKDALTIGAAKTIGGMFGSGGTGIDGLIKKLNEFPWETLGNGIRLIGSAADKAAKAIFGLNGAIWLGSIQYSKYTSDLAKAIKGQNELALYSKSAQAYEGISNLEAMNVITLKVGKSVEQVNKAYPIMVKISAAIKPLVGWFQKLNPIVIALFSTLGGVLKTLGKISGWLTAGFVLIDFFTALSHGANVFKAALYSILKFFTDILDLFPGVNLSGWLKNWLLGSELAIEANKRWAQSLKDVASGYDKVTIAALENTIKENQKKIDELTKQKKEEEKKIGNAYTEELQKQIDWYEGLQKSAEESLRKFKANTPEYKGDAKAAAEKIAKDLDYGYKKLQQLEKEKAAYEAIEEVKKNIAASEEKYLRITGKSYGGKTTFSDVGKTAPPDPMEAWRESLKQSIKEAGRLSTKIKELQKLIAEEKAPDALYIYKEELKKLNEELSKYTNYAKTFTRSFSDILDEVGVSFDTLKAKQSFSLVAKEGGLYQAVVASVNDELAKMQENEALLKIYDELLAATLAGTDFYNVLLRLKAEAMSEDTKKTKATYDTEEFAKAMEIVSTITQATMDLASSYFDYNKTMRDNELMQLDMLMAKEKERWDAQLSSLTTAGLASSAYYRKIEKEAKESERRGLVEKERLQGDAFEKERSAKIAMAGVDFAMGLIRIWSQSGINIILGASLSAMLAGTFALQTAAMASAKNPYRKAFGGWVPGQDTGADTTPILAMPGEFVVRRDAAQNNKNLLEAINSGASTQSSPIVININGDVIGTRSFVEETLMPEIKQAIKNGYSLA